MVEWRVTDGLTDYDEALRWMEARVAGILSGAEPECVWLLEHPALYTAGTSAREEDLLDPDRFPVFAARRGGEYTYHGPGQRVVYVMLDLNRRGRDVRRFVRALENWAIAALAELQVAGERREGRVGVWVRRPEKTPTGGLLKDDPLAPVEEKIAAVGVRLRRWVSFHGLSINVDPDLEHFAGIVPCGQRGYGVTSLADMGLPVAMKDVDLALRRMFGQILAAEGLDGQPTPAEFSV